MDPKAVRERYHEQVQLALDEAEDTVSQYESYLSDLRGLERRMKTLPDQVRHDVMVPLGGKAFMPGQLIHTNEVLVLLGDDLFAERSVTQALGIIDRRKTQAANLSDHARSNVADLRARLGIPINVEPGLGVNDDGFRSFIDEEGNNVVEIMEFNETVEAHASQNNELDDDDVDNDVVKNINDVATIDSKVRETDDARLTQRLAELARLEEETLQEDFDSQDGNGDDDSDSDESCSNASSSSSSSGNEESDDECSRDIPQINFKHSFRDDDTVTGRTTATPATVSNMEELRRQLSNVGMGESSLDVVEHSPSDISENIEQKKNRVKKEVKFDLPHSAELLEKSDVNDPSIVLAGMTSGDYERSRKAFSGDIKERDDFVDDFHDDNSFIDDDGVGESATARGDAERDLHMKEIEMAYHEARLKRQLPLINNKIGLSEEERPDSGWQMTRDGDMQIPLTDSSGEPPKKMSRFMAARKQQLYEMKK